MSSASVSITGYLAVDPQVNQAGRANVTKLRIATNKRRGKDRDGVAQEVTTWWGITVWGVTGEHCARYLSKGRLVTVYGDPYTRTYTDRDGNERTSLEVDASRVDFLGRNDGNADTGNQGGGSGNRSQGGDGGWGSFSDDDGGGVDDGGDNLPF